MSVVSVVRDGVRHDLDAGVFWTWASNGHLRHSDMLLATDGRWERAERFPQLRQHLPRKKQQPDWLPFLVKTGLVITAGVAAYKVGQALFDEDFGGRAFPASFRRQKIERHVEQHGAFCFECDREVGVDALTVDHIVPWAKGGLTSKFNADVMCGPCNSSKRDQMTWRHRLRGRSL